MNNFSCGPTVTLRCCGTALKLSSYRDSPAILTAVASLCNGNAVNQWMSPSRCGSKSKLRGFQAIQISVYWVNTPHLRTVTLAQSDPLMRLFYNYCYWIGVCICTNMRHDRATRSLHSNLSDSHIIVGPISDC